MGVVKGVVWRFPNEWRRIVSGWERIVLALEVDVGIEFDAVD